MACYPETEQEKELFDLRRRCRRAGLKLLLYLSTEFPRSAPEWPMWSRHWVNDDTAVGHRNSPHVCFNSEWKEFILCRSEQLIKKYDLDGIYLDAWALWQAKQCANPVHGCGYTLPDGTRKKTFPYWQCRDLMERIYVVVKSINPQGQISQHAMPGLCVAHFGTDCFAGEG